jgi:hypothetical protein
MLPQNTTFAEKIRFFSEILSMAFQRSVVSLLPSSGIFQWQLARLISTCGSSKDILGRGLLKVCLVQVDGGFSIYATHGYQATASYFLMAEHSGQRRVFKTLDAAFRTCKKMGLFLLTIEGSL